MATQKQLEEKYFAAKDAYYNGDEIMSDAQFDILEEQLKAMGSTVMYVVGSKKVGDTAHWTPMLSLGKINVKDEDNMTPQIVEFTKWMFKCLKAGSKEFEASSKFDGIAIGLNYDDGILRKALTRGDGIRGFDIKDKVRHLVPHKIPYTGKIENRGEIVSQKSIFNSKYSVEAVGKDLGKANARNYVGGILSTEAAPIHKVKELTAVMYEVRVHTGNIYEYPQKIKTMDLLTQLGFNASFPVYLETFTDSQSFTQIYYKFKHYREKTSPFLLDGMVIKAAENSRKELGYTGHHPEWAIAIKFPPKDAMTHIASIDWKTGSSGEVVPTANLVPIDLDGSNVKRATLFNKGYLVNKGAWPGAKVTVAKAGDIIPQIYEIVTPSSTPGVIPTHCLTCSEPLTEDSIHLWCTNDICEAQVLSKLEGGIKLFKIKGVGGSGIKKLYHAGFKRVEDFFDKTKFNESKLIQSGQFVKGRSLDIVLDAINALTTVKLAHVIQSMKISDVGEAVSKQVALKMSDMEYDTKGLNGDAWAEVTETTALGYQRLNAYLSLLQDNFITVEYEADVSKFKTFEMSGNVTSTKDFKSKDDYVDYFKKYGYRRDKLTANSDFLLISDHSYSSGKVVNAKKLQSKGSKIQILTYKEFIENEIGNKTFFDDDKATSDSKVPAQTSLF